MREFRARLREVVELVSSGRRRYVVITRRGLAVAAVIKAPTTAQAMAAAIHAHTWRRRARLANAKAGTRSLKDLRLLLPVVLDELDQGLVHSVLVERYWQPVVLLVPPEKAVAEIIASPRQAVVKQLLRAR